ncbi:hypothetical protein, partial [Vibrio cholerae]
MNAPSKTRARVNRVEVHEVHSNLTAEVIEITSEKLELILREHLSCLAKENAWHAPLGILITIILVLLTTDFRSAFGLNADTWKAVFLISTAMSAFWLVSSLFKMHKSLSIEQLLDKVKN